MAVPVITSNGGGNTASISLAENSTAVTTVTATDADVGDVLRYSIVGGDDAAKFKIDAVTGALVFVTPPDFELPKDKDGNNIYQVQVQVKDAAGNIDIQVINITITDVTATTVNGTSGDDTIDATHSPVGQPFVTSENDTVNAGDGNDTIDAGMGADTMVGGNGDDTYFVDNAGDVVTEAAGVGTGTDTVNASVTHTLAVNVENLILTGTSAINGTGNASANTITGNSANNKIDGGLGVDTMIGGNGSDTYIVNAAGETVTELAGQGTDTVQASVSYTLSANVENLILTGSAALNGTGNGSSNKITGNSGSNILIGNGGHDTIDGGLGADDMRGGVGNDVYIVDNASDTITELAGAGTDTVQSKVTFTLGSEVENLTLTGSSAISGTGNSGNNALTGNIGNNTLTGMDGNDTIDGGNGNDTMIGGDGDDTYVVNVAGDVVTELAGGGTDTIIAKISASILSSTTIENLTLSIGTSDLSGEGNDLANVLTGNSGNNTLIGHAGNDTLNGGSDADSMEGGEGNDTYIVDHVGDQVVELAGEGSDLVKSSVDFTLGTNVERLELTGTSGIDGTGNASANTLTGNSGANMLLGLGNADTIVGGAGDDTIDGGDAADSLTGGAGVDVLTGGLGNDTFIFTAITDSGLAFGDRDTITAFATGDKIDLSAIDANAGTAGVNDAFVIDTDNSFSTGEIRLTVIGTDLLVSLNNDADAEADMTFLVQGVTSLTTSDFTL